MPPPGNDERSDSLDALVVALAVALGIQTVRALPAFALYLLHARLKLHPALAVGAIVPVFFAGALSPALARRLRPRAAVAVAAGGVALARLGAQVWPGDQLVVMAFVLAGAASFFVLLPTLFAVSRAPRARLAAALLLGVALDTAVSAAFRTYDPIWRSGGAALAAALVPAGTLAVALWRTRARLDDGGERDARGVAWEAVGAFLFLELAVFQNPARLAAIAGGELPIALACVATGQALGVAAISSSRASRAGWIVPAVVLCASLAPVDRPLYTLASIPLGQAALAVLVARVVEGRPGGSQRPVYTGLVLAGLVGLFSLPAGVRLPYRGEWVYLVAAAIVIVRAAHAAVPHDTAPVHAPPWLVPVAALALAAPVAAALAEAAPSAEARTGEAAPVRVVSFNIHKGFDTRGRLDLEATAAEIEAERPDVVALQEVSRGQLSEGCVDEASWLSRRLGVPCVYAPSGARLWGQAVLTRLPVLRAEQHLLPPLDLPTARSYVDLDLDVGWDGPLRLVDTHYSSALGTDEQLAHSRAIADALGHDPRWTVLAGDLNATPKSPPLRALFAAGLVDSVAEAGLASALTAPSRSPTVRIDYVLHSTDLTADGVTIRPTLASDHFPGAVTVAPYIIPSDPWLRW